MSPGMPNLDFAFSRSSLNTVELLLFTRLMQAPDLHNVRGRVG